MKKIILLLICAMPLLASAQSRPPYDTRKTSVKMTAPLYLNAASGGYDPVAKKSIPYYSVADANKATSRSLRTVGLPIIMIGDSLHPKPYWYYGGTADSNLVPMSLAAAQPLVVTPLSLFLNGYINGQDIGLTPDYNEGVSEDKWTDNSVLLQRYLDSIPAYTMPHIYVPHGAYWFKKTIKLRTGQGIDITGDRIMPYQWQPSASTVFHFGLWRQPCNGFEIDGDAMSSTITDLQLLGSAYEGGPSVSGIYHTNICRIERVWARSFTNGFYSYGAVEEQSNSSLSIFVSCRASDNLMDGFYVGGPDANSISYYNCVAVQNWYAGFHDNSFLGCAYYTCQTATNGSRGSESNAATVGGGWVVTTVTGHTQIVACYSEQGDQLPNYIVPANSYACANGGLHGSGWTGALPGEPYQEPGGDIVEGVHHTHIESKLVKSGQLSVGVVDILQTQAFGEPVRLSFQVGQSKFFELVSANVPHGSLGQIAPNLPQGKVKVPFNTVALPENRWEGSQLIVKGSPDMPGIPFQVGYRVNPAQYDPNGPEHWRCITPGRNGATDMRFRAQQPIGNYKGDQSMQSAVLNPEDYRLLMVGDYLNFDNGALGKVWAVDTELLLEINNPAGIHVHVNDDIDWFGKLLIKFKPVGYTENSIIVRYTPVEKIYKVGESEIIDGKPTTVLRVTIDKGVQLVTFDFPKDAQPDWFRPGADIGFTKANISRRPWSVDATDPKRPTITVGFPMANIEDGAYVQVDNLICLVKRVITPGVAITPEQGRVWGQQNFTIQKPVFKAY